MAAARDRRPTALRAPRRGERPLLASHHQRIRQLSSGLGPNRVVLGNACFGSIWHVRQAVGEWPVFAHLRPSDDVPCRREADIADRGRERQDWAGSYPSLATAQWPKSGPKQT